MLAWLPAISFTDQTSVSQTINATASSIYYAVAQSPDGCIDTAQVSVTVIPGNEDVFVPNVFTPNGDGKNDDLRVYGNLIQSIDLTIFNQWGELIFNTKDKNKGWDGRHKGVMQPITVYVYVLKAVMQNGSVITKKGSVTLVR
jgi:gliding motility-associated-like protein